MTVAESPHFNFVGNVPIGDASGQLPLPSIAARYDALLFAYGASKDRELGIPGEQLRGVVSARAFVGWYNGLPEYADLKPDLQCGETAVIIGQGNVALDVARFLLSPIENLRQTDVAEHALETLKDSKIRDVKIIGRRGPLQAPYTIKELRELMTLSQVGYQQPPESWDDLMQVADRKRLPRQLRRIAELLEKGSATPIDQAYKAWQLGFLRAPAEFLSSDGQNLTAVGFERTAYDTDVGSLVTGDPQADLNAIRAVRVKPTGSKSLIKANLAFRSVGYVSQPIAGMEKLGIPFDTRLGILPNDSHGRILSPNRGPAGDMTAGHVPGMYCAGWVKRGPTGVIASTMDDAFRTGDIIAADWSNGVKFNRNEGGGFSAVKKEIDDRGLRSVSWQDWSTIDQEELRRGKERGKVREKFRSNDQILRVLDS